MMAPSCSGARPTDLTSCCRLLLGHGRGDYHPITQNCEHAARWCKTGRQWCSQTLTPGHGNIPFEDQLRKLDVLALKTHVEAIKSAAATSTLTNDCAEHNGLHGRTLFWMDSFSAEIVHVRNGLARRVFNRPPTIAKIYHPRLTWTSPTNGNSSLMALKIGKRFHQHANWPRHVEFAASFLKTSITRNEDRRVT
ncbi:hypothetical protein L917_11503 [Phytophthora nicotianae]|uniref:LRAT domain-containing protein n=3 Tax=Phytophthora nicotianae TaxID=4792 RepID=V9EUN4_PHYNI|nr:hypothetical protein F443_12001 [Phytophthora nicotianae P1569]ETL89592.1 hypothetical protein L917_11503 [Phytophthora nicotianae]ETM42880.1 hypothetical protein L914_11547 [Phytophthora nicotianae]ETO71598.1 hypothetical protein F444_12099 [Phytophthora nicotianae P1976]